jgi:hypothetical protein
MKLPSPETAVVDIVKLRDYCLNGHHPRGRHKARVFAASLELSVADAEKLRRALLDAARNGEASESTIDSYGTRYNLDFLFSHAGRQATIRSAWIVRRGESFARLTSCYVL